MCDRESAWKEDRVLRTVLAFGIAGVLCGCDQRTFAPGVDVSIGDSAGITVFTTLEVPAWDEPALQWRLTVERAVATAGEDLSSTPMIFEPQGVTRFPDGTLVVLDGSDLRLVVVDPVRDSVTARFAPRGQGPGEVWSANAQIWPEDHTTLGILDMGNRRVTYFSLEGEFLRSNAVDAPGGGGMTTQRPGTGETFAWRYFRDPESGLLSDSVIRLDVSGPAVSVAALPRDRDPLPPGTTRPLFSGSGTFAPIGSGGVIVGRTDASEFRHYGDSAELMSVIRVPFERRALTLEDERIVREELASFAPRLADNLGEHAILWSRLEPLGDSLFALNQTSVTSPAGEARIPQNTRIWRIFSVRGRYLGALVLPTGAGPPYWNDGERLMAVQRDSLGVATIVVYRLEPPPAGDPD
jgi:hypothetical protein